MAPVSTPSLMFTTHSIIGPVNQTDGQPTG